MTIEPDVENQPELRIRPAERDDLPALTAIYNHYVRTSHATFDVEEFTVEQRAEWFGHYAASGPHRLMVADRAGAPVGYATSSPFRPKPAYRTSVETSVYVGAGSGASSVGTALYSALLAEVDEVGIHRCYAGIALPNDASIALHRRFGFAPVGTFGEVGHKFGRYWDVQWYQRG